MALMATDLPVPVAPATSRCGIRARSHTTGWPSMLLPSARVSSDSAPANASARRISLMRTISRSSFGTSRPITERPCTTSTTRTLFTDSARARSLAHLVMLLPRTPGAGSRSKCVITGPGDTATTLASTPNSSSLSSICCDMLVRVSSE